MYSIDFSRGSSGLLPEGLTFNDFDNKQAPRFVLRNNAQVDLMHSETVSQKSGKRKINFR